MTVAYVGDEMNVDSDPNGQLLRTPDKRSGEPGVREHGEVCPRSEAAERLGRVANGVHHGFVGEPESVNAWWAGGSVEIYAHARVIHHPDDSVSVIAPDELGALQRVEERARK